MLQIAASFSSSKFLNDHIKYTELQTKKTHTRLKRQLKNANTEETKKSAQIFLETFESNLKKPKISDQEKVLLDFSLVLTACNLIPVAAHPVLGSEFFSTSSIDFQRENPKLYTLTRLNDFINPNNHEESLKALDV